ncbi:coproporphyrinogen iii oxidase [Moniliophthora roreri MCA 2997]|uniref:coproporphyrinogen oxidase n=2 Tax=Moniliophthora roreri TaxID=221103 RepID=V2X5N9_MONRO|nr:coproporphyrinogen iii oxidase [Moniliophthora roreri MCA 2997]KAI3619264.1 coproporphyrinogen iii oxidase [Moniliophthora roreri]
MSTKFTPDLSQPMRNQVESYIRHLQNHIVTSLEALDPSAPPFKRDAWIRPEGGEGQSCVFAVPPPSESSSTASTPETILEKAGVNISIVHGTLPPPAIKQMRSDHASIPDVGDKGLPFFAAGISLVIHPRNPHAPTVHMNYRYFEITESATETSSMTSSSADTIKEPKVLAWWFGGGADLTPSYLYDEDAVHFHKTLRDAFTPEYPYYPAFKKWCDEYFYLPHRKETRGVGGIFFDDLNEEPHNRLVASNSKNLEEPRTKEGLFKLIRSLGDGFTPSYIPILEKRARTPYTEHQRRWQLLRRGRYVEFNLVIDRGTKFGLMTPGARVESILMSLPEVARWEYMSDMGAEGTEEGKLMEVVRSPKEWA